MKKFIYTLLFVFTLILIFVPTAALDTSLYGENMHVDMYVQENGVVEVNTKVDMYFNRPMQGIFVELPIKYSDFDFSALTGDKHRTYYFPVTNFKSTTHRYEEDSSGLSGVVYRLGTAGRYLEGSHTFEYSYNIQLRDLELSNDQDYFFMNLLGDRWEFPFESFSFEVTFEKPINKSSVAIQMKNDIPVSFQSDEHTIKGEVKEIFYPGDALTVLVPLGENYFSYKNYDYTLYTLVGSVAVLTVIILIYLKHGRKYPVVDSVEFTAPEGLNSADVGYVYHGYYSSEAIISLIIYWASQGYLLIEELDKNNIRLTKLMDMHFGDEEEIRLFNGLFGRQESVTTKELEDKFYTHIQYAKAHMPHKFVNEEIFDRKSNRMEKLALTLVSLSFGSFVGANFYKIYGMPLMFWIPGGIAFIISNIFLVVIADSVFKSRNKGIVRKTGNFILGLILFGLVGAFAWLMSEIYHLNKILLVSILMVLSASILLSIRIRRRTEHGTDLFGKVLGLRRFVETAEKHRLEMLVEESPEIFYDVLPYAYVLGVSDKWSKKFENIAIQQPDWYVSRTPGNFNSYVLWRSLNRNMSTMRSTMTSIPASKGSTGGGFRGGSSGGGGFSGGGFGGGGGGGW